MAVDSQSIGGTIFILLNSDLKDFATLMFQQILPTVLPTFRLILTLVLVGLGYLAISGKVQEATKEVITTIILVPIVYAIGTDYNMLTYFILQPLFHIFLGLTAMFLTQSQATDVSAAFLHVDSTFTIIMDAIHRNSSDLSFLSQATLILALGILAILFGILYAMFFILMILSLFATYVFIIIAPIPVLLAAFKKTRHIFFAWFRTLFDYGLIAVFTGIVMGVTIRTLYETAFELQSLDVDKEGVFNATMGSAYLISLLSIFFHMKAPEFASKLTGGSPSSIGSFMGFTGAMIGAGAYAADKMGITGQLKNLAGGPGNLMKYGADAALNRAMGNKYAMAKNFADIWTGKAGKK